MILLSNFVRENHALKLKYKTADLIRKKYRKCFLRLLQRVECWRKFRSRMFMRPWRLGFFGLLFSNISSGRDVCQNTGFKVHLIFIQWLCMAMVGPTQMRRPYHCNVRWRITLCKRSPRLKTQVSGYAHHASFHTQMCRPYRKPGIFWTLFNIQR